MATRMVKCAKFGTELPGLDKPPFAGDVGKTIFERVSKQAWDAWSKDMQIKVLNEYRLNLGDKRDYEKLVEQMMRFLNLSEGSVVQVENAERGRVEK